MVVTANEWLGSASFTETDAAAGSDDANVETTAAPAAAAPLV